MEFPDDLWEIVKSYMLENPIKKFFRKYCSPYIIAREHNYIISSQPIFKNKINNKICVKIGSKLYLGKNPNKTYTYEYMTESEFKRFTYQYLNNIQFRYFLSNNINRHV